MKKWLLLVCFCPVTVLTAQVRLQTGAAEAGFPLFQFNDAKSRLSTGVSLHYISGNGIKVNELAGSVGAGWALQAAGIITRIQHGEPDDQLFTGPALYKDNMVVAAIPASIYPDGFMYSTTDPQNNVPSLLARIPIFDGPNYKYKYNIEDREIDEYQFEFNGRSGRFVIGKNKVPQVLDDSKLKISFTEEDMTAQMIRTRISSFTITDEAGIQFKFSEKEVNDLMNYSSTSDLNNYKLVTGQEISSMVVRKVISKWFLTEIENALTGEKIVFNYDNYSIDLEGAKHLSKQEIQDGTNTYTSHEYMIERIKKESKRLVSILFPDLYKIEFNYAASERVDLPGDKALTEINVLYNNNMLYGYRFNYSYFFTNELKPYTYSFQPSEIRFARLCLTDFYKTDSDGNTFPAYKFTYNLGQGGLNAWDIVPPMFSLLSDHLGYYNPNITGVGEHYTIGAPVYSFGVKSYNSELLWSQNGTIQKIEYPEGGSIEYEYELNRAEASSYLGNQVGGVRVHKTTVYDGESHTNDIVKVYKYINSDNTSSGWGFETPLYTKNIDYKQYQTPGGWQSGSLIKEMMSDFVFKLFASQFKNLAFGAVSLTPLSGQTSTGAAIQNMLIYIAYQLITIFFTDPYKEYTALVTNSDNINLNNSLPFQYSRVEVEDEGGSNGKVVYEFTSDQFYALRVAAPFVIPFSTGKQRFAHWLYGLPKMITWYNSSGEPVRKVENIYNPIVREINDNNYLSRSWEVNKFLIDRYDLVYTPADALITQQTYYPIQGRAELEKTKEIVYNNNGESTVTETTYAYSDNNFLPRIVSTKDSKGNYFGTTTYYTADFDIAGEINDMKTANMVNLPVSVNGWVKGPQTTDNEKLVSSTVTEYAQIANGDYRPSQVYQSELTEPADNTVADADNFSSTNYKNYTYLQPQAIMLYAQGNPAQTIVVSGNSSKSSLYDYNQRLLVAEVSNAAKNEIQYTSFEADGTGGWVYNQNGVISDYCPTGKKCFNLNTGVVTSGITTLTKPAIISLWTTGTEIVVNKEQPLGSVLNFTPVKTGPEINGWKYCEFEIPYNEIATLSLTITGNGLVDEVRYYPKNARMQTYTYEPGIGKTSECDINNRITYFEYDGLGRLIQVKDQYRNLVKAYEYNYKQ